MPVEQGVDGRKTNSNIAVMINFLKSSFVFMLICASSAHAQTKPVARFTTTELESFFDSVTTSQMDKQHIAGAVVILVKDGQVLFKKGYGYANVENKTAVSPDETIFRIGSISKVFTATAIMQLVDKGLIKIDNDVNTYLTDWKIPEPYSKPVTFANLLTHSAGFDEISPGRKAANAESVIPLGTFI